MFDSPLQHCPVCRQHVALDHSKEECVREQHCEAENCPLSHLFVTATATTSGNENEKPGLDPNIRSGMESYLP